MGHTPSFLRETIAAHDGFPLGRPKLIVVPGAGPVYVTIKKVPTVQHQLAGLRSTLHAVMPQMVRITPYGTPSTPLPKAMRFRIDGHDNHVEEGYAHLSPEALASLWDDLGPALAQARPLSVEEFDDLEHWALMHDSALSRLKSGNYPGFQDTLDQAPQLHSSVMAEVDRYHQRLVEYLERTLHAQEPGRYPVESGWLGIPSGVEAPAREMVPLRRLLASAPEQAAAQAEPVCEIGFDSFSMDF